MTKPPDDEGPPKEGDWWYDRTGKPRWTRLPDADGYPFAQHIVVDKDGQRRRLWHRRANSKSLGRFGGCKERPASDFGLGPDNIVSHPLLEDRGDGIHMGVDYTSHKWKNGPPVPLPFQAGVFGTARFIPGDYNTIQVELEDGRVLEFLHASKSFIKKGEEVQVRPDTPLGLTGDVGAEGKGIHLHVQAREGPGGLPINPHCLKPPAQPVRYRDRHASRPADAPRTASLPKTSARRRTAASRPADAPRTASAPKTSARRRTTAVALGSLLAFAGAGFGLYRYADERGTRLAEAAYDGEYDVTVSAAAVCAGEICEPGSFDMYFRVTNGKLTGPLAGPVVDGVARGHVRPNFIVATECKYDLRFTRNGSDVDVRGSFYACTRGVTVTAGRIIGRRTSA